MQHQHFSFFHFMALCGFFCASCSTQAYALRNNTTLYRLDVLVDGALAPTYHHHGETYLLGEKGKRYTIRVHNRSNRRVEAVISVDGLDVIDGKTAHYRKRGYIIPPWGMVDVDGWRVSYSAVAAFRFSSVDTSYAALKGKPRNIGVIGVAIFPEKRRFPKRKLYLPRERYSYHPGIEGEASQAAPPSKRKGPSAAPSGELNDSASARESAPTMSKESSARSRERRASGEAARRRHREGLATAFGERRYSSVSEVSFTRENSRRPAAQLGFRYNNYEGLIALGIQVYPPPYPVSENHLRRTANPFPLEPARFATPPRHW